MRSSTETKVISGFAIALAVLLAVAIVGYRYAQRLSASRGAIPRFQEIERSLRAFQGGLSDAEAAQRGFGITGDVAFLETLERASKVVSGELVQLQGELESEPEHRASVVEVRDLTKARLAELHGLVEARRTGGIEGVRTRMAKGEGRAAADRIELLTNLTLKKTLERLTQLRNTADESSRGLLVTLVIGGALSLGILAIIFQLTMISLRGRRRAERALKATEDFKSRMIESSGD